MLLRSVFVIFVKALRSLPDLVKGKVFVLLRDEVSGTTRKILEETVPGFSVKWARKKRHRISSRPLCENE